MKLLVINPRLLVVQIDDEMIKYAKHVLSSVSWKKGGGLQMISYDTQFKVGTL